MASSLRKFICTSWKTSTNLKYHFINDIYLIPIRNYISTLFMSGRNAKTTFSFLTPYIDLDDKLRDLDKYQQELTKRGVNVDMVQIKKSWDFYKSLNAERKTLEEKLEMLVEEKKAIFKSDKKSETATKIAVQIKLLSDEVKKVKNLIWDMQETFITEVLKLPNGLDERTPLQSSVILKTIGTVKEVPERDRKSHIEIGEEFDLLEYRNPIHCYLSNEAALFELGALNYAAEVLRSENMVRVVGADFCRSTVIEAAGLNYEDPLDAFVLQDENAKVTSFNRMHLVGSASLLSFLAFHTKQLINPRDFPVKYFTTGRQYQPFRNDTKENGLFTLCQTSVANIFVMVKDIESDEYRTQFDELISITCKLYDNVVDHYRVVMQPVSKLKPSERMRVTFEIWSSYSKEYVEVGHISTSGDYFTKRLLIAYQTPYGRDYPTVISGTVLSVPTLLGCLMEQNPKKFVIPDAIAKHMPVNIHEFSNDPNESTESSVKF